MWKPVDAPANASGLGLFLLLDEIMKPASADGAAALPNDVLIVEDDPILALDFEDTILGFGVKTVRTAGSVAKALKMIADRAPDFALLDVGLVREKSFAIAERLDVLKIPFVFVTGYGVDVRLPAALADKPRLPKPCSADALRAVLKSRSGGAAED
jgi:CheY-like chemotaxis protein